MLKTTMLTAVLVMAASGLAHAGGQEGSIGVGAEYQINGLGGASVNYDAGAFHVGGFLLFDDQDGANNTTFAVGGRFYYHLHSTAMADFGIGGRIGILSEHDQPPRENDTLTEVYIEPGVQMRVFLAANVAISASVGVSIGVVDASGVTINGQTIGAGLHYYFF
ncbi:MAG TPA: hypothetical protein VIV40_36350 [Kofleriaceae bacterium]